MAWLEHDYATEVRRTLVDPFRLCERLGLTKGARRQAGGLIVRCPVHEESMPSCSITRGPDGTIRSKCFGCDWTGDALTIVAAVYKLDTRADFRDVLLEAASIAGLHRVVDELHGNKPYEPRPIPAAPPTEPERDYPPLDEVAELWRTSGPCDGDDECKSHLAGRGLDASAATRFDLARALVLSTGLWCQMPKWARYQGNWWPAHGYKIIIPTYDATGTMRGVRAWRVSEGDGPKRLPPSGHRATGLVLANPAAVRVLRGERGPSRIVICEGEPDLLTWAIRAPWLAVLGVLSGSWTSEFAARVPLGSEVIIRTHHDEAGDRYAGEVLKSVRSRAIVLRGAA
jgi:hypothetical protein